MRVFVMWTSCDLQLFHVPLLFIVVLNGFVCSPSIQRFSKDSERPDQKARTIRPSGFPCPHKLKDPDSLTRARLS